MSIPKANLKLKRQRRSARPHCSAFEGAMRAELFILEYGIKKAATEMRTAAQRLENIATHVAGIANRVMPNEQGQQ